MEKKTKDRDVELIRFCTRSPKITENKKVKNAKKVFYDNIWFDSGLEAYVYSRLVELKINFTYATQRYEIIHPFVYQGEKVRAMTYKPDFVGRSFMIEVKGWKTDAWRVREKLVKRRLSKDYPELKYYTISSKDAFDSIINEIIDRENDIKYEIQT